MPRRQQQRQACRRRHSLAWRGVGRLAVWRCVMSYVLAFVSGMTGRRCRPLAPGLGRTGKSKNEHEHEHAIAQGGRRQGKEAGTGYRQRQSSHTGECGEVRRSWDDLSCAQHSLLDFWRNPHHMLPRLNVGLLYSDGRTCAVGLGVGLLRSLRRRSPRVWIGDAHLGPLH